MNPKEIKKRILSINSVVKTTEAMKMISIVKLRKSKESLLHIKTYSEHIKKLFLDLIETEKKENLEKNKYFISDFSSISEKKKQLFLVFTSNKGLCGGFNSLIFNKINKIIQKKENLYNQDIFFSIGKKGLDFLYKKKYNIYNGNKKFLKNFTYKYEETFLFVKKLISDFLSKKISSIFLMYNHLKNSFLQEVIVEKFLPIPFSILNFSKKSFHNPILEPSKKIILDYIIPKFLNVKLFKTLLESSNSEHTARMISMHKATENASNIKKNLLLNYNKERQTTITKEILEIISGLEALKK
ncbi:ATP synthase F1 subunit gamma [Blattabacterium cuenoti]|uniref:ATP synthase F1 subunit gamma n=1 Tax=Blattabacterium cuenoti TaxID=1653831 RepID=UPI00293BA700|nr:ATP synthase F1 subunit gamma [Blattabacterium cuenoti]